MGDTWDTRAELAGKDGLALPLLAKKGAGDTWDPRAELAGRNGLALPFLENERWETLGIPELSWRVGRSWPYHFLRRKAGRHMGSLNLLFLKGAATNIKAYRRGCAECAESADSIKCVDRFPSPIATVLLLS